jgi:hypothetical protein
MTGHSKNFDKLVHEEQARLASLHPTPNDVPGCLTLFDTFMQCYGSLNNLSLFSAEC